VSKRVRDRPALYAIASGRFRHTTTSTKGRISARVARTRGCSSNPGSEREEDRPPLGLASSAGLVSTVGSVWRPTDDTGWEILQFPMPRAIPPSVTQRVKDIKDLIDDLVRLRSGGDAFADEMSKHIKLEVFQFEVLEGGRTARGDRLIRFRSGLSHASTRQPGETETIETIGACLDRTSNFMASREGITVAEEIVRPAVQQAIEDYQRKKRNKKGGA
jgi:hypothetical protein